MTREQVLQYLRRAAGPVSVAEVAGALAVHPNTVRFHLRQLVTRDQVVQETAASDRPGRPALLFSATRRMAPDGPTQYQLLAQILIDSLTSGSRTTERVQGAGRQAGRRIAEARVPEPGTATDRLVALLDDVGFAPEPAAGTQIRLRHCPFLAVAAIDRVVCAAHLGLMRGVLDELGADDTVERLDPFVEPDLCIAHLIRRERLPA